MMNKNAILSILLCAALASGCSTQTIQQGKDLSSSGIAYSNAVDGLVVVTADRVIDFDTAELKKSRIGSNPGDMIHSKNQQLIKLLAELNKFRS